MAQDRERRRTFLNTVIKNFVSPKMWGSFFFFFFSLWRCGPTRAMASPFLRFLDHAQRRITVGRTPLDA